MNALRTEEISKKMAIVGRNEGRKPRRYGS